MNHANGTSFEIRVTGSFRDEPTDLFLVNSRTSERIDCVHDAKGFEAEKIQSGRTTDETFSMAKRKDFIDCRANLTDGIYWVQQGDYICQDIELCSVTVEVGRILTEPILYSYVSGIELVSENRFIFLAF